MINKNGEKITSKNADTSFIASEIRFIMKGFKNGCDDRKAQNVAERIVKYLKAGGEISKIESHLEVLNNYSAETKSSDFLWELVYIRRIMMSVYEDDLDDMVSAAQSKHMAATYFDKICELTPTYYNHCCRVMEYTSAAAAYGRITGSDENAEKSAELFEKSEKMFFQIEEKEASIYYEVGAFLYFSKYFSYNIFSEEKDKKFESIKKSCFYSRKNYEIKESEENLRKLALIYSIYVTCEQFSFSEEETFFKTLIAKLEAAVSLGNENLASVLRSLKVKLRRFESE